MINAPTQPVMAPVKLIQRLRDLWEKSQISLNKLREFGFTLGLIFSVIFGSLIPLYKRGKVSWLFIGLGLLLIVLAWLWPRSLSALYKLFTAVGHCLGYVNSRILLSVIFVLVITPIALLIRLTRKDPFSRRLLPEETSYKINCDENSHSRLEEPY